MNVKTRRTLTLSILSVMSSLAFANEPWSTDRQWLLGDWNGERQALQDKGYKFDMSFVNQSASNVDGGYNDDQRIYNASQLKLGASFDLDKIAGWKDTQASLVITERDGASLATKRTADPRAAQLSTTQEIYGRGQSWRINQMWIKKGFDDNKFQVKFGRMGFSEDFNSSQCEFQNWGLCGSLLGKVVGDVWYNAPVSVWAINAKYQFTPEWSIATGVYEVNSQDTKENGGFNLEMRETSGATIPVELAWKPKLNGLPGEYKVGAFYSTADATDIATDANGNFASSAAKRKVHDNKHSFWINMQQKLTENPSDPKRGLYATANFTFNDKATSKVEYSQQFALWYKGLFDMRPQDSIALGVARFQVNKRVTALEESINASNGLTSADYLNASYKPVQHDEVDVELNYTYNWSPSIMIRPNIQYIHQPGGVKEVDDAWVAGLSVRVNF